jgi:hypothetical protein
MKDSTKTLIGLTLWTLVSICTCYIPFFIVGLPAIVKNAHSVDVTTLNLYANGVTFMNVSCNDNNIFNWVQTEWLNNATNALLRVSFADIQQYTIDTRSFNNACNCVQLDQRYNEVFQTTGCHIPNLAVYTDPIINAPIFLCGGLLGIFIIPPFILLGYIVHYIYNAISLYRKEWKINE